MNRKILAIVLGVCAILTCGGIACAAALGWQLANNPDWRSAFEQFQGDMASMIELQQRVTQEYGAQAVSVNLMNSRVLVVTLINSPFSGLPDAEQRAKAREIAGFVNARFTGKSRIETIRISFAEQAQIGPVSTNQFRAYDIDVRDLR
ncbi:MAG: hypothetical protein HZB53_15145 [Chloroflexi bacterium]|nr:hypothetical protein [Chloroflexota bacterium]